MWKKVLRILLQTVGAAAALLGVLLAALTVAEYMPGRVEEIAQEAGRGGRIIREGDRIELLTFDIGYAGLDQYMDFFMDGGRSNTPPSKARMLENLEGIAAVINSQSYDVLLLQEVDRSSRRSYGVDQEEWLHGRLSGNSVFAQDFRCLFIPYPVPDVIGAVNSGLQTITGLNIRAAQRIALPNGREWPGRIFAPKSCMLLTRTALEDSGRELVIINLHMDSYGTDADRAAQLEALAEVMQYEYEMGNYVIAGGNFNQAFPDDDFSAYPLRQSGRFEPGRMDASLLRKNWQFVSDRSAPTSRLRNAPYSQARWWAQYYVLDGYILSPNVLLEQVKTVNAEFRHSDHNPVKIVVQLLEY